MKTFSDYYAVIMAGGGGTRLWPLSRKATPKQVVNITGDKTLFQIACDRLNGLFTADHILVVTIQEQVDLLHSQVPEIPLENYLIEPLPRGTASVVGFAAAYLQAHHPGAVMAVLTADHFIENLTEFQNLLQKAYEAAKRKKLVTLGIQPTYAATGFGYIQHGESLALFEDVPAFSVAKFKEKPAEDLARQFFLSGDHDWNSGMFIWEADTIMSEFRRQMPELFNTLQSLQAAMREQTLDDVIACVWEKIIPETIDYGIMENAQDVIVLHAKDLQWFDVGSWESLFSVLPADENANIVIRARHKGFSTENSLVYSQTPEKLIVTIGMKNTIIVDAGNALLVCSRENAQDVKKVVDFLKENSQFDYL